MRWIALAFFVAAIVAGLVESRSPAPKYAPTPIPAGSMLPQSGTSQNGGRGPFRAPPGPSDETVDIPVAGVRREALRSTFNEGRVGHIHHAMDILAPRGTPVLAAVDGSIRKLFSSGDGGLTIYETDPSERTIYYYAHLDRYAGQIVEGLAVHRGETIGYVGTTGNAPRNTPHLHFAIMALPPSKEWWKGEPRDPYPVLMQHGVTVN